MLWGGGKSPYKIRKNSEFRYNKTSFFNDVFIVNGFTLIELIGVIILLGVIGLITYPIVNKSIRQSKENALEETIRNLEKAGEMYSVKNDIGYSESYNNLDIQILKDAGLIKNSDLINPMTDEKLSGCLLYRWVNKQYEFKYTEPCVQTPTITLNNKDGVFNNNGWSINPFYVSINSNTESYEYCVSDKECNPDTIVNNGSGEVYINQNGNNYVCVRTSNDLGSTNIVCEQYKLDISAPVIASNVVYFDKGDKDLAKLLEVNSSSGYSASCDKGDASELEVGSNTVSCTVTSNNGLSTTQTINFTTNNLRKVTSWDETTFLGSTILKENVESIKILDHIEIPDNAKEVVDVSEQQNRSIMAWYTDNDNDGMYELYVGQDGGVVLKYGSCLFRNFINVENIDVLKLDTSTTDNMEQLFAYMRKVEKLDLSNFDTSKATIMRLMFYEMRELKELDISSFDTSSVINLERMFSGVRDLKSLDVSHFNTSKVTNMKGLFQWMHNLESLDVSNFDTSQVINMEIMFQGIDKVKYLDVSKFNTSKVTNMEEMFGASDSGGSLITLDVSNFDTSNVTDMGGMFYSQENLTVLDLSGFDTSNVTNMGSMLYKLSKITTLDVSNFDTSQVTDMHGMFSGMTSLTELDLSNFDTSQVTNMNHMFSITSNLKELDLSNFDTSKVTTMSNMFVVCGAELNISSFDTSNVTDMSHMFRQSNSSKLDLSNFDTSKVTDMSNMFYWSSVTDLDLSSFDTSKVTDMSNMFNGTASLTNLNLSNFDITNVTNYENMFLSFPDNVTISVNSSIENWINERLNEVGKNANIVISN